MLSAVFADIHANLQAYEAFMDDCRNEKIDRYYFVGDIVGYGTNPKECINITQGLKCPSVCGNHDWAVAERLSTEYFNQYAKASLKWTACAIDDVDKTYLDSLPLIYREANLTLVHGSLDSPEKFKYVLDVEGASENLDIQKTLLTFVAHSHIPAVFFKSPQSLTGVIESHILSAQDSPSVEIRSELRYLINVGSVGQPRDGNWRGCYCIYDDKNSLLRFRRFDYNVGAAAKAILDAGLPSFLADRLERGK